MVEVVVARGAGLEAVFAIDGLAVDENGEYEGMISDRLKDQQLSL